MHFVPHFNFFILLYESYSLFRPFLTGSSIFDGDYHNDGGFAMMFGFKGLQQNCYSLRMPWRMDLMSDYLNLFLSRDRAKYFWEEGLKKGLD